MMADGSFESRIFSVMHFNIYCQDVGDPMVVDYFPAEVGIAKFSLKGGLVREYVHEIMKPGKWRSDLTWVFIILIEICEL